MYDTPAPPPGPGPLPVPASSVTVPHGLSEELAQFNRSLADATDGLAREYVELVALAAQMLDGVYSADSDSQFSQLQGRAFECGGAAAFWSRSIADLAAAFADQDNPQPVRRWLSEIAESCLLLAVVSDVQDLRDSPLLNPMQLLDGIEAEPVGSWLRRWASPDIPAPESGVPESEIPSPSPAPQVSPYPYAETEQPPPTPGPVGGHPSPPAPLHPPHTGPSSVPTVPPAGGHPSPPAHPHLPHPGPSSIDGEPDRRRAR